MTEFEFLLEKLQWKLPPEPGTQPVPEGHVRLYHQTSPSNLNSIRKHGIQLSKARGIEGPKAIYADEKGFYGKPEHTNTVEFHVHKNDFRRPFVHLDQVHPKNIIAIHKPWHSHARYIENDEKLKHEVIHGHHDDLKNDSSYGPAIRFIKHKYGAK